MSAQFWYGVIAGYCVCHVIGTAVATITYHIITREKSDGTTSEA